MFLRSLLGTAASVALAGAASAGISVVNYTVDLGGDNGNPLNGLGARGTFEISGNTLTVLLENTSTGAPNGFDVSDSLLVSVAFNLPGAITIVSGDSAVIGAGSVGLGAWGTRTAGDSVGEEWLWTNGGGGDYLGIFDQVVSTSSGVQGSGHLDFNGNQANVNGPFGGIAADPPIFNVPQQQRAVSDSIFFTMTLSDTMTNDQLNEMTRGSVVEYGSDQKYLGVPAPGAFALLIAAPIAMRRRRRNA